MSQIVKENGKKVKKYVWEISKEYRSGMQVPSRIIMNDDLLNEVEQDVVQQITNVAMLPGMVGYTVALPDAHTGYGYPIGGVSANSYEEGVISPGGIGFDINCGVRMIKTSLKKEELSPKIKDLINALFNKVPAGVGKKGFLELNKDEFFEMLKHGTDWCIENDYGVKEDVLHIEDGGCLEDADPTKLSDKAVKRGLEQLGTLGSGNHYLEIQSIEKGDIFNEELASKLGFEEESQVSVMIHCGSRGFGHQIGTDYLKSFVKVMKDYNIGIKDKQLACAPISSKEGKNYYAAMCCAANFAFVNRQVILHRVRNVFEKILDMDVDEMGMELVYDVAHNIAKKETHEIDGKSTVVMVHRKGATRAFPPHHREIPNDYKEIGQPVILGGSMETGSYLLVGKQESMKISYGSAAHGAGRRMSRSQAKKEVWGEDLKEKMEQRGIIVKSDSMSGLAEEAGIAYKDIDDVVSVLADTNICEPVLRVRPFGNIKG